MRTIKCIIIYNHHQAVETPNSASRTVVTITWPLQAVCVRDGISRHHTFTITLTLHTSRTPLWRTPLIIVVTLMMIQMGHGVLPWIQHKRGRPAIYRYVPVGILLHAVEYEIIYIYIYNVILDMFMFIVTILLFMVKNRHARWSNFLILPIHPLKCVQFYNLLSGTLGRMFGGTPHLMLTRW